jgi:hypothetical protein
VLGITQGRMPRFVKNFQTGRNSVLDAVRAYVHAVKERGYPASEHEFHLAAAALTLDAGAPLPSAAENPAARQALPAQDREDDEPR